MGLPPCIHFGAAGRIIGCELGRTTPRDCCGCASYEADVVAFDAPIPEANARALLDESEARDGQNNQ